MGTIHKMPTTCSCRRVYVKEEGWVGGGAQARTHSTEKDPRAPCSAPRAARSGSGAAGSARPIAALRRRRSSPWLFGLSWCHSWFRPDRTSNGSRQEVGMNAPATTNWCSVMCWVTGHNQQGRRVLPRSNAPALSSDKRGGGVVLPVAEEHSLHQPGARGSLPVPLNECVVWTSVDSQ